MFYTQVKFHFMWDLYPWMNVNLFSHFALYYFFLKIACLCGYVMCKHRYVCRAVCTCVSLETQNWCQVLSVIAVHLIYQERAFHWTGSSPIPASLASQVAQWIPCICLPRANYDVCFDLIWVLGILCFHRKLFIHWASPPGLPCILLQGVSCSCRPIPDANNTSVAALPPCSHQTNHWTPFQEFKMHLWLQRSIHRAKHSIKAVTDWAERMMSLLYRCVDGSSLRRVGTIVSTLGKQRIPWPDLETRPNTVDKEGMRHSSWVILSILVWKEVRHVSR